MDACDDVEKTKRKKQSQLELVEVANTKNIQQ